MYVIRPQGVSRSISHWSRGVAISGVRFWNLTASQPAATAASIRANAFSRSPLWLMPISPVMYTGWPLPMWREPTARRLAGRVTGEDATGVVPSVFRGLRDFGPSASESGTEQPGGDLTDRPVAAVRGGDGTGGGPYDVMCSGDGDGPADQAEARQVVDVVAGVEHPLRRDAVLLAPLLEREVLAVDAVQNRDLELTGPSGDDRVGLGGQDQYGQARAAQRRDPETVTAMHGDGLVSVRIDQHPVIGLGAVEVEYDRVDVVAGRGGGGVEQRRQRAGPLEIGRLVDLQHPGRVGAHQRGAAEEAVAGGAEAVDAHRVRGARLQQVLRAVLAARPGGFVMVHTERSGRGIFGAAVVPPDEAVEGRDGVRGVRAAVDDRGDHAVDLLAGDERAGALHQQHHVGGRAAHRLVRVHRVQDGGFTGGGVPGDGDRAQHDLGAGRAGDRGDGRVIGGDHHGADPAGAGAGEHRAGDQRYAAE